MTAAHDRTLSHQFRRLVVEQLAALPDGDLLRAYLDRRDETAFAALVERHGPTVLGVCRAVLGRHHDAEDAFQATFLVLARKADSILRAGVAGWLQAVAYRIARKARAAGARRHAVEAKAPPPAPVASADDLSWGEVRALLHQELAALPERYREPLVLCHLHGLTRDEAARRLGWTETTVKGRLQRGRDILRRRLERRGLGLSTALGAATLADRALAEPVPAALAEAAVRAVLSPGNPASPAAALAAALPALTSTRLWGLTVVVLVASLAAGFAVLPWRVARELTSEGLVDAELAAPGLDLHGDPLPPGAVARLGTVRFNHGLGVRENWDTGGLNSLHYLRDGKTILSEGSGLIRLWDAGTGKELGHFGSPFPNFIRATVLTPDGKTLVQLNRQRGHIAVRFWDTIRKQEARVVPLPVVMNGAYLRGGVLSGDGRLCAIVTDKRVQVFDTATGEELSAFSNEGNVIREVSFAGDRLVTADAKQVICVWQVRTGELIRRFDHGAPAGVMDASDDGRFLAVLENHPRDVLDPQRHKKVVHVWDLTTGTRKHTLKARREESWFRDVCFAPGGNLLFASAPMGGWQDEITVWDVSTGQLLHTLNRTGGTAFAVSPDGARLATGSGSKFDVWDLKTGRRLSSWDSTWANSDLVFLSPTGDRAFALGDANSLLTWDGRTGRKLRSDDLPGSSHYGPTRTHSPDGRYFITFTGNYKEVQPVLGDVTARGALRTLQLPDAEPTPRAAFSPDSTLLATWSAYRPGIVRLWDVRTGRMIHSFKDDRSRREAKLFFSSDRKILLIAGQRVHGFDIATGKERFSWRPETKLNGGRRYPRDEEDESMLAWRALAVSPSGTIVAHIPNDNIFGVERKSSQVVLCDAKTGLVLRRCRDTGRPFYGAAEQLVFSPDGRLVASSENDLIHLWEVATAQEIRTFRGHRGDVRGLSFSADGRRLASGSADTTVVIWDLTLAPQGARPPGKSPGEAELAAWWDALASANAGRGQAAVRRLAEAPGVSVPFLRQRLRPATEADVAELRSQLANLEGTTFLVRDRAARQLRNMGWGGAAVLFQALENNPSLELRRRLEQVLEGIKERPMAGEPLRAVRAVAALEYAGTAEARALLRELAAGAPEALLTQEARAAVGRLTAGAARRE